MEVAFCQIAVIIVLLLLESDDVCLQLTCRLKGDGGTLADPALKDGGR